MKRIKNFGTSGIWEFWLQIFHRKDVYHEDNSYDELKKPSMSGNVFVIFSVLLSGVGLAVGSFMVEVCKVVYPFVVMQVVRTYLGLVRFTERFTSFGFKNKHISHGISKSRK